MSFLEKAKGLFIEGDEDIQLECNFNESQYNEKSLNDLSNDLPTVEVPKIDDDKLLSVDEVYNSNNLSNKEKSIYKVNEIKNALPDMPTDAKKASVLGMLSVSKIDINEVKNDSELRINALIESLNCFKQETDTIVNDAEVSIKEKEAEIEKLKSEIATRKQLQEQQNKLFEDELTLIKTTTDFIS